MGTGRNGPPRRTPSGSTHRISGPINADCPDDSPGTPPVAVDCRAIAARAVKWVATAAISISGTATSATSSLVTSIPYAASWAALERIEAANGAQNSFESRNDWTWTISHQVIARRRVGVSTHIGEVG